MGKQIKSKKAKLQKLGKQEMQENKKSVVEEIQESAFQLENLAGYGGVAGNCNLIRRRN